MSVTRRAGTLLALGVLVLLYAQSVLLPALANPDDDLDRLARSEHAYCLVHDGPSPELRAAGLTCEELDQYVEMLTTGVEGS